MGRDHDGSSWCGAINCSTYKKRYPELTFHRFPRDPARSKQWVQNCRRADLQNKSTEYLHKNVFLCSRHFEASQYHKNSKRLLSTAVPTVFSIPNPPKPVSTKRPLVERQEPRPKRPKHEPTSKVDWTFMDDILLPTSTTSSESNAEGVEQRAAPAVENQVNTEELGSGPVSSENAENEEPKKTSGARTTKCTSRYRSALHRLREKNAKLATQSKKKPTLASADDVLSFTSKIFNDEQQRFLKSQLKHATVKPRGRRFSDEEVMEGLALYYQSPKAYRHLRRKFALPSPRCLRRRIESVQMQAGFQDWILAVMKEKFKNSAEHEKLVVVSFDEMQVRPKLTYLSHSDVVEGTEDFGEMGKTSQQADCALVFMARGVTSPWKQPVGYMLSKGATPARVLKPLLETCIRKLREAGFTVVCTVCDMGTPNQELLKNLGVHASKPHFEVDGGDVICLYDVPHLMKCLRNTLLKQDVTVDGKTASWNHIRQFHAADKNRKLRCAPKLSDKHVSPGAFQKMKVRFATQVLSRTVAAGISMYSSFGLLPSSAEETAEFLQRLNCVFDVLNASSPKNMDPMKRAFMASNIAERRKFLEEVSAWLGRWSVQVPSVQGLQQTIAGVLSIWDQYGEKPLEYLLTRRLNQDALENLFGVIRMKNGLNEMPDPVQFRMALRQCVVTRLMAPTTANCEVDGDALLSALTSVAQRSCGLSSGHRLLQLSDEPTSDPSSVSTCTGLDQVQSNVLTYVAGYLIRRGQDKHDCRQCGDKLAKKETVVVYEREILCGLKSFTGLADSDVGSLVKPTQAFFDVVVYAYSVVEGSVPAILTRAGICAMICDRVMESEAAQSLTSVLCEKNALRAMLEVFTRMTIHRVCKLATQKRHVQKRNKKLLKVQSRV